MEVGVNDLVKKTPWISQSALRANVTPHVMNESTPREPSTAPWVSCFQQTFQSSYAHIHMVKWCQMIWMKKTCIFLPLVPNHICVPSCRLQLRLRRWSCLIDDHYIHHPSLFAVSSFQISVFHIHSTKFEFVLILTYKNMKLN